MVPFPRDATSAGVAFRSGFLRPLQCLGVTPGVSRKRACIVDKSIGFDELQWLQELRFSTQKKAVPDAIGALLLTRGLIERKPGGFALTARGRIALAKLA